MNEEGQGPGMLMLGIQCPVQQQPPSWCGCPATVNNTNENHSFCAVCLGKYDCAAKIPMGLGCGHTVCRRCALRLHPDFQGLPNAALLSFLEFPMIQLPPLEPDCGAVIYRLCDIALLLKAHTSTRAIHRKVLNLICSLTFNGQNRVCKAARAIGERVLTELCAACSHLSHYHAQQQLWGAIRSRACQFMGPAMQEEALKLVLLALEDGSPLSRKVLVMFVVQRLAPQFPQASKTSIGHVIQLLYRASCFDVTKRLEASSLMTLRPEYRNYESLRREHDAQIVKIALECGIRFSPEQWSSILYGDSNHKPHMQSIIDKLQAPQTFLQMTTEFLVTIQRLTDSEDTNFFLSIHPRFQLLASIEILPESPPLPWAYVNQILEAVHCVLLSLFNFTAPKPKSSHNSQQQRNGRLVGPMLNRGVEKAMAPPAPPRLPPELGHQQQYFPTPQPSTFRGVLQPNGFSTFNQQHQRFTVHPRQPFNHCPSPSSTEIKEILTESRLLQARMKELQEKMPAAVASALEEEAFGLEEAVTQMVQRVSIH